ncbi:MAG: PQQ-binding-like beta-propeller repeat protein [Myxococcota bacterium]
MTPHAVAAHPLSRSALHLAAAVLLTLSLCAGAEAAGPELLYATEGNRLRRLDIDTLGGPAPLEDVLIDRASAAESGGAGPTESFRDLNGMVCLIPDGSGRFVAGEDTGQPSPPPGWGVFSPGGEQIGKLTATYNVAQGEPFGCAFDPNGLLFTTEVGGQDFGTPSGQLILWFPPYDRFPGPAGAYPNTDAPSTSFCKIATDIGTAGGIALDRQGRVYVAAASQLSVFRFSPPFPTGPDAAGGCGSVDALGSPLADSVQRETFLAPNGLSTYTGLALAPNGHLYAAEVITGRIGEYDLDGNLVRMLVEPNESLPPISTGTPQGITVGGDGTLYYADLDLVGTFPALGPGPDGKVWRVRFDASGNPSPPEVIRSGLAFPDGVSILPGDLQPREWRSYAGGPLRQFFQPAEASLTAANVGDLTIKWTFQTGAIITGSPSIARVEAPGEGRIAVAYFLAWDANVYAVRIRDGSELWRFTTDLQPGASFPHAGSTHMENVAGRETVLVGSGETLYALDAITGAEIWRFEAGTGCGVPGACGFDAERNEIESSPIAAGGRVLFGMDVNDRTGGKGGFYAVDVTDGRLAWYFDPESGATCTPDPGDEIRRFDGYHSEAELGLPVGFFASRSGCDFPRVGTGCGNVWSSPAFDAERGWLFFGSSNCDTDSDPNTLKPDPPMPPFDEALVALDLDGHPVWHWRPREVDNADLAFGAVPNLFTAVIGGEERDVVGIGNKDGTYYTLDRDGVNEINGVRWDSPNAAAELPYWSTNVVAGGTAGGILATAAVDDAADRIYFGTAPGSFGDLFNPQRPTLHALDAGSGDVLWQNTGEVNADATFSPTSAVPGVVFTGSVLGGFLRSYDATNGEKLGSVAVGTALAAAPAVVDGLVLVGAGIGARADDPNDLSDQSSRLPQNLTALCVPGTPACAVDIPIAGTRLRVIGDAARPAHRRFIAVSRDSALVPPSTGGNADPSVVGAVLELLNPSSGETQRIALPASHWSARGDPPGARGYLYRDPKLTRGPCSLVRLAPGRLRVSCRGEALTFTLDQPTQGALAVALRLGNESVYCLRFGGSIQSDRGGAGVRGRFSARAAPAPIACPLP